VRKKAHKEAALAAVDNLADRIFFVTSVTWTRRPVFQSEPAARMLLDKIFSYRERGIFSFTNS
jgi:hypothetical protein